MNNYDKYIVNIIIININIIIIIIPVHNNVIYVRRAHKIVRGITWATMNTRQRKGPDGVDWWTNKLHTM